MSAFAQTDGLDDFTVKYSRALDVRAEVEAVVVGLGGQVDQSVKSRLVLQAMTHETATPIPNPFECDLTNGQEFEIFTARPGRQELR